MANPWKQIGLDLYGEAEVDEFGGSVSLSGDGKRLAIGAYLADPNGDNSGRTRVYEWISNAWTPIGQDIDGVSMEDYSGSVVILSADGTRLVVLTPNSDIPVSYSGDIRVYNWNASTELWEQLGSPIYGTPNSPINNASLSRDGTTLAVGIPYIYNDPANKGKVRVYKWDGTDWSPLSDYINGNTGNERFGKSVSLNSDGTILAIGASNNASGTGSVRVYNWDGTQWDKIGLDINGDAPGHSLGSSVSLSSDGTILAIGGPGSIDSTGSVKVYNWNGSNWINKGSRIDGEDVENAFGNTVSLSADGTRLAVGAPWNTNYTGSVRVYNWNASTEEWDQIGLDIDGIEPDEIFGNALSINTDGTIVAIGASANTNYTGRVQVYKWNGVSYYPTETDALSDTNMLGIGPSYVVGDGGPFGPGSGYTSWKIASNSTGPSAQNVVYVNGDALDASGSYNLYPSIPCFLEGTKILCKVDGVEKYVPVEQLNKGTQVKTSIDGYKRVVLIGKGSIHNPGHNERTKNRLYKCSTSKYPELKEDLYITGCHSIIEYPITEKEKEETIKHLGELFVTDKKYRLMAFLDERAEPWNSKGEYTIWHFALENEDVRKNYGVYANGGLLVETCSINFLRNKSNMVCK